MRASRQFGFSTLIERAILYIKVNKLARLSAKCVFYIDGKAEKGAAAGGIHPLRRSEEKPRVADKKLPSQR